MLRPGVTGSVCRLPRRAKSFDPIVIRANAMSSLAGVFEVGAGLSAQTVLTKTAKGVLEVKNRTIKLSRPLRLVFLAVDGSATIAELAARMQLDASTLQGAIASL